MVLRDALSSLEVGVRGGGFDCYLKAGFWLTALGRGLCVTEFFPDELCGTQVYLVFLFNFSLISYYSFRDLQKR